MDQTTQTIRAEDINPHYRWNRALPANALVISGPSKTADIEQS